MVFVMCDVTSSIGVWYYSVTNDNDELILMIFGEMMTWYLVLLSMIVLMTDDIIIGTGNGEIP
jgi:hypothetical protein